MSWVSRIGLRTSSSATRWPKLLIGVTLCAKLLSVLGISTKSIYRWQRLFSRPARVIKEVDAQADEIRRLKRDLVRVMEEQDNQKEATAYFARESR